MTDTAGTTTTVRRYTDESDNPAWIDTTPPGAATTTSRFAESIGGDLSATIGEDGTTRLSLADPHGDIVTAVGIAPAQPSTAAAIRINGWASYDEYGNASDRVAIDQVDGPIGYGWLGAKQRSSTNDTAGLTLMGARLYNPTRGLFTGVDPVFGGNESSYAYPSDPINTFDLDGQARTDRKSWLEGVGGAPRPHGGVFPSAVQLQREAIALKVSRTNAPPRVAMGEKGGFGAGKKFTNSLKSSLKNFGPWVCTYCGKITSKIEVDHIIAKKHGGTNARMNATLACRTCNASKGSNSAPKTKGQKPMHGVKGRANVW